MGVPVGPSVCLAASLGQESLEEPQKTKAGRGHTNTPRAPRSQAGSGERGVQTLAPGSLCGPGSPRSLHQVAPGFLVASAALGPGIAPP